MKKKLGEVLHPLYFRKLSLVIIDAFIIIGSYILSIYYAGGSAFGEPQLIFFKGSIYIILLIQLLLFKYFRFYSSLWEYAGLEEVGRLFLGVTGGVILAGIYCLVAGRNINWQVFLIAWSVQLIFTAALRFSYRGVRKIKRRVHHMGERKRVMIVGAGEAGAWIAKEFKTNGQLRYHPVVFIDDDKGKHRCRIQGIYVAGGRNKIPDIVTKYKIEEIILALPSAPQKEVVQIAYICSETGIKVKTLPPMEEIILEGVNLHRIRDIDVHDFLGRDEVDLKTAEVETLIKGGVVLVTGGGGSIGSELCRQILRFKPKRLIIFDIYENNAYDLQNELLYKYGEELEIKVLIGSVRDKERLEYVFYKYRPDVVFHAAAHKHVPLMEENPGEAVKNNVYGTLNVATFSDKFNVKSFVLISTDKAVNPTNVMGATKRVAEMIVQCMSQKSKTKFTAVRFGNVLGSNGSVVPLFKTQISRGGPVTVTHPDVTRYFMTIPEAAQLVLQAGAMALGGEIFVLDMGNPIKIVDLARKMIVLSGFKPDTDIEIVYTGLRPGEKLYEELLLDEEDVITTSHSKIFTAKLKHIDPEFMKNLNEMEKEIYSMDTSWIKNLEKVIGKRFENAG